MIPNEYQGMALRTEADAATILRRMTLQDMRLDNAARGLAGDAGEISTCVQKHIEYGQPLDRTNLLEEVGDCLWRLAQLCDAADFTLEQAMVANLAKLRARYPNQYSDVLAAEEGRDRVAERTAIETSLENDSCI